jgi:hypothetical protein
LNRAVGAIGTIKLNGKEYRIAPLALTEIGAIENRLEMERPDPIKIFREMVSNVELPQESVSRLMEKAYEDAKNVKRISSAEVSAYMNSLEGVIFCLYLSLAKANPNDQSITLEFVRSAISKIMDSGNQADLIEIQRSIDRISGMDESGNSTGSNLEGSEKVQEGQEATGTMETPKNQEERKTQPV